ncbi:TPA: DsbA family protein [Serratia marcescens]
MKHCDPSTGACRLPNLANAPAAAHANQQKPLAVHYIGDPMCSWCWGISPAVAAAAAFCEEAGIDFVLTLGGLRAGGGDAWNAAFKDFLRAEWRHIGQQTGQPFGFTLLDAPYFDYDTEPACRAVAVAKHLQHQHGLSARLPLQFFAAIQRKFYVDGQDPKAVDFYADLCAGSALDFNAFRTLFASAAARQAVQQDFVRCRQWGIHAFPTLLLELHGEKIPLAVGAIHADALLTRLTQALANH